ncbi:MAG: hypothetical protein ACI9H6_000540 [Patiriisocius sp.]|jgi:hypothetical protein
MFAMDFYVRCRITVKKRVRITCIAMYVIRTRFIYIKYLRKVRGGVYSSHQLNEERSVTTISEFMSRFVLPLGESLDGSVLRSPQGPFF